MRESIPRPVDKKSRVPEEEKVMSGVLEEEIGVWNFQEGKNKLFFFFSTLFSLSKDYKTTVYPA